MYIKNIKEIKITEKRNIVFAIVFVLSDFFYNSMFVILQRSQQQQNQVHRSGILDVAIPSQRIVSAKAKFLTYQEIVLTINVHYRQRTKDR